MRRPYITFASLAATLLLVGAGCAQRAEIAGKIDADKDGIEDSVDKFLSDHDNDGLKDEADNDDDNDGKLDVSESAEARVDHDNDGEEDAVDADDDNDGEKDETDTDDDEVKVNLELNANAS